MFILFALVGVSCNQKCENAASTEAAPAAQVALAMPVNYSSSFEIGNPSYAAMIVQGRWKDWQEITIKHS